MKTPKFTSYITTKTEVTKMVAALEGMPHAKATWSDTGVVVEHVKAGREVLRAMIGSTGKYLVRHPEGLWA